MSEDQSLTPTPSTTIEQPAISSPIASIMETAHAWTIGVIGLEATQTNLARYFATTVSGIINGLVGKSLNPIKYSEIIAQKNEIRVRNAANNESHSTQNAA